MVHTKETVAGCSLVNVHTRITEDLVLLIADGNLSISGAVAIPLAPPLLLLLFESLLLLLLSLLFLSLLS